MSLNAGKFVRPTSTLLKRKKLTALEEISLSLESFGLKLYSAAFNLYIKYVLCILTLFNIYPH